MSYLKEVREILDTNDYGSWINSETLQVYPVSFEQHSDIAKELEPKSRGSYSWMFDNGYVRAVYQIHRKLPSISLQARSIKELRETYRVWWPSILTTEVRLFVDAGFDEEVIIDRWWEGAYTDKRLIKKLFSTISTETSIDKNEYRNQPTQIPLEVEPVQQNWRQAYESLKLSVNGEIIKKSTNIQQLKELAYVYYPLDNWKITNESGVISLSTTKTGYLDLAEEMGANFMKIGRHMVELQQDITEITGGDKKIKVPSYTIFFDGKHVGTVYQQQDQWNANGKLYASVEEAIAAKIKDEGIRIIENLSEMREMMDSDLHYGAWIGPNREVHYVERFGHIGWARENNIRPEWKLDPPNDETVYNVMFMEGFLRIDFGSAQYGGRTPHFTLRGYLKDMNKLRSIWWPTWKELDMIYMQIEDIYAGGMRSYEAYSSTKFSFGKPEDRETLQKLLRADGTEANLILRQRNT